MTSRSAAKKRKEDLRAVFDKMPEHIRIQVPEAWAVLEQWDDLLEHHDRIDLERPFTLSYRSDAVEYTVKSFSALDPVEQRAAVAPDRFCIVRLRCVTSAGISSSCRLVRHQ